MLRFRQPNKTEKGKQLPAPLKLSVIGFSRPKECHHNLVRPKNAFPDDFLSLCSYFFATVNVCFFRLADVLYNSVDDLLQSEPLRLCRVIWQYS